MLIPKKKNQLANEFGKYWRKKKNSKLRIDMNLPKGQRNGGRVQRQRRCCKLIHSAAKPTSNPNPNRLPSPSQLASELTV